MFRVILSITQFKASRKTYQKYNYSGETFELLDFK